MKSITHSQRYLPHTIETRFYAVKLYRSGNSVQFVCRRYHISKASLMRWNKRFDGTRDSLRDKSHRPVSPHPNAHTELELKWIKDLHRRNPHISICEMYGKLRSQKGYARHPRISLPDIPISRLYFQSSFHKEEAKAFEI